MPIYGVGQGSTNAPARWGFVCDTLINLYKTLGNDATINSLISNTLTNLKIAGFVNNTALVLVQQIVSAFLVLHLEQNAQLWEKLLYTTGGWLEISKCKFAIFDWIFDKSGRCLLNLSIKYHLHITSSETKQVSLIEQISLSKPYKSVGVQLSLDGSMQEQTADISNKCSEMAAIFSLSYFNPTDARQGLSTIYGPSVQYALPASSISQQTLQNIQKLVISAALSCLGFNNKMPRAVVFASKYNGGLGITDLYTEHGNGQINIIV
jgi:hypothetical protein